MMRVKSDAGNAIVEFIGITVALFVPLSVVANACILIANAYLATDISARTAARAFVVSSSDTDGTRTANSAAGVSAKDFDSGNTVIITKILCTHNPCLSPGGFVTVKVSKEVRLNLPAVFGSRSVLVTSQHTSVVDELRAP